MPILYAILMGINAVQAVKKKRYNGIVLLICFCFFVFIFSGNSSSGDIPNYLVMYENASMVVENNPISGFFYTSMAMSNEMKMNFFQYKFVLALLVYALYFSFLKKFACNIHYVIFFYLFHLFLFDVEQIRNALAVVVFLHGLIPLLKGRDEWKIKFLLFTLLATLLHSSFIIYLVLLLYDFIWKRRRIRIYISIVIMLCAYTFLNNNQIPFLQLIMFNFDVLGKVDAYFGNKMQFGFGVPMVLHIVSVFTIWFIRKRSRYYNINNCLIDAVYRIFVLSLSFLPLYFLSITFGRLERNLLPLILLVGGAIVYQVKSRHKLILETTLVIVLMVFSWCVYAVFMRMEDIFLPVMEYNYFVNGGIFYYE